MKESKDNRLTVSIPQHKELADRSVKVLSEGGHTLAHSSLNPNGIAEFRSLRAGVYRLQVPGRNLVLVEVPKRGLHVVW